MANIKLDFNQITKMTPQWWNKQGQYITQWVKEDALKGIFQNGKSNIPLRSAQYRKYKANRMERFTNKTGNAGTKLKSYMGVAIKGTNIAFSDMYLTGKTLDRYKVLPGSATKTGVTCVFNGQDSGKILGGITRGADLVDLNEKNQKKLVDNIVQLLDENIRAFAREKIVITVGRR